MLWLIAVIPLGIDTCYSVGWDSMGNYTEEGDSDAAFVALQLIYPSVTYARCRGSRLRFHLHGNHMHDTLNAAGQCLTPTGRNSTGYTARECAKTDYSPRVGEIEQAIIGFISGVTIAGMLICVFAYTELSNVEAPYHPVPVRTRRLLQVKSHHT